MYPDNSAIAAFAAMIPRSLLATRIEGSGEISSKWLTSEVIRSMSVCDLDEFGNK